ncbi:MlaE family lipid ABC transporter permease subunit [Neiella marina]|uniref:MlaE family lipid ABC transporter permease subunit n=1 Tax=Neiella holothuriorum TaxID=2870530 RepID=A0ABS7EFQ7_9GAMM|nr:MlaE family lipid ABC transporter permease subunit [Neiella holothuriorum]MBW8191179.1 MlaE family lipid ABC transporter permease subunit [Neiella holothuriorum]
MSEQSRKLVVSTTADQTEARLSLLGDWRIDDGLLNGEQLRQQLAPAPSWQRLVVDGDQLGRWDSSLMSMLRELRNLCQELNVELELASLPQGVLRLMQLADSYPTRNTDKSTKPKLSLFERIGKNVQSSLRNLDYILDFLGHLTMALVRLVKGQARYRSEDVRLFLQDAGPGSFKIVALISLLVGVILAFVGAVQLRQFGAEIYVASLVGLGMGREMGAMMTAIIMAGRTGAAYAAQIGSMQVNEEVDALKTMGLSDVEFLVLPRVTAMLIMLPLLTIFSIAMGILGGALVSSLMLDIGWLLYIKQMSDTVALYHYAIGLAKSILFALVIVMSGCIHGLNCGRSATAVGKATTLAVVHAIVAIIVVDSVVTILLTVLGL